MILTLHMNMDTVSANRVGIAKMRPFWAYLANFVQFVPYFINYRHGLRTPNEGINQRNLKIWADVADKICFGCT